MRADSAEFLFVCQLLNLTLVLIVSGELDTKTSDSSEMFRNHFNIKLSILKKTIISHILCLIRLKKLECTFELHVKAAHSDDG